MSKKSPGARSLQRLVMAVGDYWDIARGNLREEAKATIGYRQPCEADVLSTRTGRVVGFWGYGYYSPHYPRGTRFGEWVAYRLQSHNEVAHPRREVEGGAK